MKCVDCNLDRQTKSRVVIEKVKASPTRDAQEEYNPTSSSNWETLATRWAAFKTRGGSERFASDMIQAGQTHRVYVRYDATTATVTPAMRLNMNSRIFNILAAADEDEQRKWIVMDVVEAKPA